MSWIRRIKGARSGPATARQGSRDTGAARSRFRRAVRAGVLFALLPLSAQANLLINGSFEMPAIVAPNTVVTAGSGTLTGWTISGASGIDLVRTLWGAADGAQSISLNWVTPSTISQSVVTVAGQPYTLGFQLAAEIFGGPDFRTLDVLWNGITIASPTFSYVGQGPANMGWMQLSYGVVGTGLDVLAFRSTTPDNYGPALDDIDLSVSAVPEPEPLALTMLGLALVWLSRRPGNKNRKWHSHGAA